jgi:NAD-dependent DNA ligase
MRIVFTGPAKVEGLHLERKYLVALARDKGHEVQTKVDASTDWLVTNEEFTAKRCTRKMLAASQNKVTRISPAEFLKQMDYS